MSAKHNGNGGHTVVGLARGPRVLVIEDDPELRFVLRVILEDTGYEVLEAPDGHTGTLLHRQTPCDVIVTDLSMPREDGIQTVMNLRREFPAVKMVAMSDDGPDDLWLARQNGADLALSKPIGRLGLALAVRRALRMPAWQQPDLAAAGGDWRSSQRDGVPLRRRRAERQVAALSDDGVAVRALSAEYEAVQLAP